MDRSTKAAAEMPWAIRLIENDPVDKRTRNPTSMYQGRGVVRRQDRPRVPAVRHFRGGKEPCRFMVRLSFTVLRPINAPHSTRSASSVPEHVQQFNQRSARHFAGRAIARQSEPIARHSPGSRQSDPGTDCQRHVRDRRQAQLGSQQPVGRNRLRHMPLAAGVGRRVQRLASEPANRPLGGRAAGRRLLKCGGWLTMLSTWFSGRSRLHWGGQGGRQPVWTGRRVAATYL